jgi:hypothetical protein
VRGAREQYSGFVAFAPSKPFISKITSRRGRLRGTCFVAFSILVASSIDHVNFASHSTIACATFLSPKGMESDDGTLCSPLELHLSAALRAVINHVPGAESSPARSPNESHVH